MKFELIRELDDGQRVFVSAYGSRTEAERQAQSLSKFWPGVYTIREAPYPAQTILIAPDRSARDFRP